MAESPGTEYDDKLVGDASAVQVIELAGGGGLGSRHTRIGGIAVELHPAWWLVLVVCGLPLAVVGVTAFGLSHGQAVVLGLVSALAVEFTSLTHEAGHLLVGARLGLQPVAIRILWLGAAVEYRRQAITPMEKVASALAGPAANLIVSLLGAGLALAMAGTSAAVVATGIATLNLVFALLNLLPVYPQDGGQVLHGLAWWVLGDERRALRLTGLAGLSLAVLTLAVSVVVGAHVFLISGLLLATQGVFLARGSIRAIFLL